MIPSNILIAPVDEANNTSPLLTHSDMAHQAEICAPARRAQWSSWRVALRGALGQEAEVRYNSEGAPMLVRPVGDVSHLSVSHSSEYVAVILSAVRCGIDIEQLGRNFSRIASRYIAPHEREQFEQLVGPHFEALWWCAKEALYKWGQATGVDFTHQMLITAVDTDSQTLTAELYDLPTPTIHYRLREDIGHVISWVEG